MAVSVSLLVYYGMQFATAIEQAEKYMVQPGGSIEIQQRIVNASQGAYVVALPDFSNEQPVAVRIRNPANQTVVDKSINSQIMIELFETTTSGVYTLTLSNPSSNKILAVSVILGDQEKVLGESNIPVTAMAAAFTSLLFIGIAAIIAGAAITVLDLRKVSKMKQFGDTSDLV